jgi:flagellar biosynthetic protein FliR
MLELTNEQIGGWVASFLLPLFRVASLLMVMPIFGAQFVPNRVRLLLALAITLVLAPNLPPMPMIDALSLRSLLLIGEQVIIGVMLGFVFQLFFQIFIVTGQIISMQMGLGFASMMDPANGVSVPLLGQFLLNMTTLMFLAMNGHLVAFEILAESFTTLPVGGGLLVEHYREMAGKLTWVMAAGLLLALPAVTALLVVNIAFGVMTRAAPQLNIFSIGFPLTLVLGQIIFWLAQADILAHFQVLSVEALQLMRELAQAR